MKHLLHITLLLVAWLSVSQGYGQSGYVGSYLSDDSHQYMEAGMTNLIFAETLIIGPEADWEIHGTVEIWSRNIYIDPKAKLHGTGKLVIHDPGQHIYYENVVPSATRIDANGNPNIALQIELRNTHNLILAEFHPQGFASYVSNDLLLQAPVDLAVDDVCIELNGNILGLGKGSSILQHSSRRMVSTGNKVSSQVYMQVEANRTAVFPVGIAEGDYTPAILSPNEEAQLVVSVQDYTQANVVIDRDQGMDRVWYIYADKNVNTVYTLQHNQRTNGSMFIDRDAQIWQYVGGDSWLAQSTEPLDEGLHATNLTTGLLTDALRNYFTKKMTGIGPQAKDDVISVELEGEVLIPVLANDDAGSSPIILDKIRVIEQPQWGTVTVLPSGEIQYVPTTNTLREDRFVYQIEDENGLTSSAEVRVTILAKALFIPNVITPNGDGENDVFVIRGLEAYDNGELMVMTRWGTEVYRSVDYDNTWGGSGLSSGTYYYILKLFKGQEETIKKGWILIKNE